MWITDDRILELWDESRNKFEPFKEFACPAGNSQNLAHFIINDCLAELGGSGGDHLLCIPITTVVSG